MTGRNSSATDKALRLYNKGGITKAQAARKAGIHWITLYKALIRQKKAQKAK